MKINVPHIAKLANLQLTKQKENFFQKQLEEILKYIGKLNKVNTSKIEETSQVTGLENVTREDKVDSSRTLNQGETLSNTKSAYNGFFKIKGIFDQEP